jgi:hypothetical protein
VAGAVLVFAIGATVGMGGVPAWLMATGLVVVAAILAGVYRVFSGWLGGGTVGSRWARAACVRAGVERVQRFR